MSACVHRRLLPVNAAKLYTTSERIEFNIIIVVDKLASQNTRFLVEVRKRQLIQALFVLCNIPIFFCDIFSLTWAVLIVYGYFVIFPVFCLLVVLVWLSVPVRERLIGNHLVTLGRKKTNSFNLKVRLCSQARCVFQSYRVDRQELVNGSGLVCRDGR